jgi:hypothetical protein
MKRKSKRRKSKKRSKSLKSKRKFDSGGCTSKAIIATNFEIITNDIIDANEFNNRSDLENVFLKNVEIIEDGAFSYCDNLENIIFSDNLKIIGNHAFAHCINLENVEFLGNNIDIISEGLFYGCKNLKNVTLSDSIRIIEQFAFYNCVELESIIMPENLEIIGKNAFLDCKNLRSVIFKRNDVLIEIEAKAFKNCYELSDFIFPNSLSKIGKDAFYGCKKITIPDLSPKGYLRIGDFSIKKLSGPTTMVILKPNDESLPIMILFGDDHGKDNPCDPCEIEKDCFEIFDYKFVDKLNSVSSSEYLVDLYLETFNDIQLQQRRDSYINDLHNVIKDCYRVKNIERYKNCKYKNMRFHYSDPRAPYIEGEKIYIEMKNPKTKKYSDDFERCFDEFIDNINNNIDVEDCMNEFVLNIFIAIKKNERNSLIYKQIQSNVYDFKYWSKIYLSMILNSEDLIENIQEYIDTKETQIYDAIKVIIFAPIMDIYFLSRNFKKDNIKKSLVIAYFGERHIINISRALTEYMDLYEDTKFYEKDVKNQRCIEFDKSIDI